MTATATKKPKKKAKAPKPKPNEIPIDELRQSLDKEGQLEDQARAHEAKIEELRQALKGEKEIRAGKLAELRRMVWERTHPEAMPLFNAKPSANGAAEHKPAVEAKAIDPTDESWKLVKLDELTDPPIPKATLQKLHDAQLYTLGELTNWTAQDGGRKRITDINGIGPGAAEKIENATTAFWERRSKTVAVVNDVAEATKIDDGAAVVDPLDAARGVELRELDVVLVGHKTLGDILDRARAKEESPLDYLRSLGLNLAEADILLDKAKAAVKKPDEAKPAAEEGPAKKKRKGGKRS